MGSWSKPQKKEMGEQEKEKHEFMTLGWKCFPNESNILGDLLLTAPYVSNISGSLPHAQEEINTFHTQIFFHWGSSGRAARSDSSSQDNLPAGSVWREDCSEDQNINDNSLTTYCTCRQVISVNDNGNVFSQLPIIEIKGKKIAEGFSIFCYYFFHSLETMHQRDIGRPKCWRMNILRSNEDNVTSLLHQGLNLKLPNPAMEIRGQMKWRLKNIACILNSCTKENPAPKWEEERNDTVEGF